MSKIKGNMWFETVKGGELFHLDKKGEYIPGSAIVYANYPGGKVVNVTDEVKITGQTIYLPEKYDEYTIVWCVKSDETIKYWFE